MLRGTKMLMHSHVHSFVRSFVRACMCACVCPSIQYASLLRRYVQSCHGQTPLALALITQHNNATLKGSSLYTGQSAKGRHAPGQLSWHVHKQHPRTLAMVKLHLPLLSRHYKATLKGSPLYRGQSVKGRQIPGQLSWHVHRRHPTSPCSA